MICSSAHTHTFHVLDLVFMNSRSKQVYSIFIYIRYVLDIHTCVKLARQTYFDYPIHVLERSSLIKIQVLVLIKFARHKNKLICVGPMAFHSSFDDDQLM